MMSRKGKAEMKDEKIMNRKIGEIEKPVGDRNVKFVS